MMEDEVENFKAPLLKLSNVVKDLKERLEGKTGSKVLRAKEKRKLQTFKSITADVTSDSSYSLIFNV